jgi:hypothetical protein
MAGGVVTTGKIGVARSVFKTPATIVLGRVQFHLFKASKLCNSNSDAFLLFKNIQTLYEARYEHGEQLSALP